MMQNEPLAILLQPLVPCLLATITDRPNHELPATALKKTAPPGKLFLFILAAAADPLLTSLGHSRQER